MSFWSFRNDAASETAELLLYGDISDRSWYGDEVTPKQFAADLATCEGKNLNVHINSPGGDVFAAQAIHNQLKAYTGKVTMYIDGMCASAATIIACAGDTVIMPANTIYMIHNPKSAMKGFFDATELGKVAKQLDTVKQTIVNVYLNRINGTLSETQLKHKMDDEAWMDATTAKTYGFVDEIADAIPVENKWENDVLIVNSVSCKLTDFKHTEELKNILDGKKESDFAMDAKEALKKIGAILGIANAPENSAGQTAQSAVDEERKRIAALDAMKTGNPIIDALVETGKKNGATAEELFPYVDSVKAEAEQHKNHNDAFAAICAILKDSTESGAANILPTPTTGASEAEQKAANIGEMANLINSMRGAK